MDDNLVINMLDAHTGEPYNMDKYVGFSMNPTIYEGDIVRVQPHIDENQYDDYSIGDILVYKYKNDGILVHRLLLKEKGKYYCKGDNAFRIEGVAPENLIGKVIGVNGNAITPCPTRLIRLSYAVNQQFVKLNKKIRLTKETEIYKLYARLYLCGANHEDKIIYQRSEKLKYTFSRKNTVTAVNDSEYFHLLNQRETDILILLAEPLDIDTLLLKLCEIYDVTPKQIKDDVEKYIDELIEKKVVVVL